jgi:hypothetical protein
VSGGKHATDSTLTSVTMTDVTTVWVQYRAGLGSGSIPNLWQPMDSSVCQDQEAESWRLGARALVSVSE